MSRNNLELLRWGDGSARLVYWDSLHGEDIIFTLKDDGTCYMELGNNSSSLIAADFVIHLIKLCDKM